MEKLIIKDNFFKNPDELRKIALSTSYKTHEEVTDPNENWRGFRSDELKTLDNLILNEACEYLKNHIDYNFEIGDLKVHSFFHMTLNSTRDTLPNFKKDRWHYDPCKYAGIVYLSPNPPQDSGTTIVIDGTPLEIENYYNRIMAYPAHYYHAPTDLFGDDMKSGRLTLSFFIDE